MNHDVGESSANLPGRDLSRARTTRTARDASAIPGTRINRSSNYYSHNLWAKQQTATVDKARQLLHNHVWKESIPRSLRHGRRKDHGSQSSRHIRGVFTTAMLAICMFVVEGTMLGWKPCLLTLFRPSHALVYLFFDNNYCSTTTVLGSGPAKSSLELRSRHGRSHLQFQSSLR
jgi:hypothetical protein